MTADSTPQVARPVTASGRYTQLESDRSPFLEMARRIARLTIPSLMVAEGASGSNLPQPFQSTGADGINNLSAKLLLALFPPGSSFFKLPLDDSVLAELKEKLTDPQQYADARGEIESALSSIERTVVSTFETTGSRVVAFEALQHLVAFGNGLLHIQPDGALKFFPLNKYVVKRDLAGNVLEIVVKECLSRSSVSEVIRALLPDIPEGTKDEEDIDIYTWVQRTPKGWAVHQEVEGQVVPGTRGTYPLAKSAWLPLRWRSVSTEDYGRGRCEEYFGDLQSLESATQSIVEFMAAAAKVLLFVHPSGTTSRKKLAQAASGSILEGDAKDITAFMLEKYPDFQILNAVAEKLEARLEKAFLNASSVQRQAERVTAEEIRVMVGELETALGGVYSILSAELQRPLVVRYMAVLQKSRKLPPLPEGVAQPQIVTGLEGLGRNTDLSKLDLFVSGIAQVFGPEGVSKWVNVGSYLTRRAAALGVDIKGLVRSEQEVADADAQAHQQDIEKASVGPMTSAAMKGADIAAAQQTPTA